MATDHPLVGKVFPVLDDGHVILLETMGSDEAIVQSARTSYQKGTKKISDDRTLMRFLMRHQHSTPIEMAEMRFHIRMPMDAWRQQIRHRTASVNEYSTRYSEAVDEKQKTLPGEWRTQSTANKQGSGDYLDTTIGEELTRREQELHEHAERVYKHRLALGVSREQARKDLPLSTYTEAVWKIDLHNLFHFLSKRCHPTAQLEIREYANVILEIVSQVFPMAYEAFLDYRLYSMQLSRLDIELIQELVKLVPEELAVATANNMIDNKRERQEGLEKLRVLGFI